MAYSRTTFVCSRYRSVCTECAVINSAKTASSQGFYPLAAFLLQQINLYAIQPKLIHPPFLEKNFMITETKHVKWRWGTCKIGETDYECLYISYTSHIGGLGTSRSKPKAFEGITKADAVRNFKLWLDTLNAPSDPLLKESYTDLVSFATKLLQQHAA
jgi:hypothetical protein